VNYGPQLLLIAAVAAVGVLHTMVPDHWVPITLIARQRGWSRRETACASFQAGIGHVMSTLLIVVVVWLAGVAFATRFGHIVDSATSIALIGFGGWIALGALRGMQDGGRHRRTHTDGHSHNFSHWGIANDRFHGPEQQSFATDEGELRLSISERGTRPHFRLSGLPIYIARVETLREDGERQLFRFENCGVYWQSIEEIPEPHQFATAVMIDHLGHAIGSRGSSSSTRRVPRAMTTKVDPNTTGCTRQRKGWLLPGATPIFMDMVRERPTRIGTTMMRLPFMS
jgi:hypothetical protein